MNLTEFKRAVLDISVSDKEIAHLFLGLTGEEDIKQAVDVLQWHRPTLLKILTLALTSWGSRVKMNAEPLLSD